MWVLSDATRRSVCCLNAADNCGSHAAVKQSAVDTRVGRNLLLDNQELNQDMTRRKVESEDIQMLYLSAMVT